jgi:hypothetical protein
VSLTDDTGGLALFPGTPALSPGSARSSCLRVSATGAGPGDTVTLGAQDVAGSLAPYVLVTVEVGAGGGQGSCAGFSGSPIFSGTLAEFAGVPGDGLATGWSPAAVPSRSFRFTVDVADDRTALGRAATATFSWRLIQAAGPSTGPTAPAAPANPPSTPTTPTGGTIDGSRPTGPSTGPTGPATATTSPTGPPSPTRPSTTDRAPGGSGGRAGSAGTTPGDRTQHPADLTITASVPERLVTTLASIARDPAPVLWPAVAAALFLLLQHRLDLRDPKLTAASRSARELTLRFPADEPRSLR